MMNERLLEIQRICLKKNIPFVSFRMPQQETSTTYIQTSADYTEWKSIHEIRSQKGFIMAPFDTRNGKKYLLIRPDMVIREDTISEEEVKKVSYFSPVSLHEWHTDFPVITGKSAYMEQVGSIRESISNGAFQKAVLSRISVVKGNYTDVVPELFQSFCSEHPNAFVYLFKSDEHFWMGASPEPLMQLRDGMVSTVSLAGTRPYSEKYMDVNRWTMKEVLEQEYVTRYIHDVLRDFLIRDYRVSSTYVKKAGNLLHLRTDFSFRFDQINKRLWEFIDAMHPTPAVAGQPKDEAISFIKKLEPHDREYYTGFLGPIEQDDQANLFVNLRCMKIHPEYLSLYSGGGITLDSVPEDEWHETRWKAESMLKILKAFKKNLSPSDALQATYR